MNDTNAAKPRLVGDVGGTNTRLALYEPLSGALQQVRAYKNRDFSSLADIIGTWLESWEGHPPSTACLAVAAPPFDDIVTMLNMDWAFSISDIKRQFSFSHLVCINDFEGNAFALPHLKPRDLHSLRASSHLEGAAPADAGINEAAKEASSRRKMAVVGPGTGLGGATLEFCIQTPVATASEPGHMGLSPVTPLELALFSSLCEKYGGVHAELILSGPGLLLLYRTLALIRDISADAGSPAQISEQAVERSCPLCVETLEVFCGLLGSLCGDYVLATGSYGGLYLAGGIVPRFTDFLSRSDFQHRFDNKGEMASHLAKVPLYAITSETTGLLGAAHAPLNDAPSNTQGTPIAHI